MNAEAPRHLIELLSDEADLCRNEGAEDIAKLLDEACAALACPRCDGSGEEQTYDSAGPDGRLITVTCQHCGGAGDLMSAYSGVGGLLVQEKNKASKLSGQLYFGCGRKPAQSIVVGAQVLAAIKDATSPTDERERVWRAAEKFHLVGEAPLLSAPPEGWRPIETAPKDGTVVIVGRDMGDFGFVRGYGRFEGNEGAFCCGWVCRGFSEWQGDLGLGHPTHWMPLPDAPKEPKA